MGVGEYTASFQIKRKSKAVFKYLGGNSMVSLSIIYLVGVEVRSFKSGGGSLFTKRSLV